jgi:hypothetical protein
MPAYYTRNDNRIEYEHHYTGRHFLMDVDLSTFTPLTDPIVTGYFSGWHFAAKDRNSVWFMTQRLDEVDPASFRYFFGGQCHWGIDHKRIYCFYPGKKPKAKIIRSGDPQSFRFLNDEPYSAYMRRYALDDKHVYYHGRIVRSADPRTFGNIAKDCLLLSGQPEHNNEERSRSDFYRDDTSVFFWGRKLKEVDAASFIVFQDAGGTIYAIDKEHAYCSYGTTLPERAISNTPLGLLPMSDVKTENRFRQVRDYVASRTDLNGYWFSEDAIS